MIHCARLSGLFYKLFPLVLESAAKTCYRWRVHSNDNDDDDDSEEEEDNNYD